VGDDYYSSLAMFHNACIKHVAFIVLDASIRLCIDLMSTISRELVK
jgi:hypothetical protein